MSRPSGDDRQGSLFDLPLAPEPEGTPPAEGPSPDTGASPPHDEVVQIGEPELFAEEAIPDDDLQTAPAEGDAAPLSARAMAAAADLAVHVAVLAAVFAGLRRMGVDVGSEETAAFLVLLLPFSFIYHLVPLAFWGRTPGMSVAGLVARSRDGERLTFGQAAIRWGAAVAVVGSVGVLSLVVLTGRSLADRLSRSETLVGEAVPARSG